MELDVLGLMAACSYALDCVEAELVHVTDKHAKRVAYMSVCMAQQMGIQGKKLQDLTVCALLHDNALTQYIQEELQGMDESQNDGSNESLDKSPNKNFTAGSVRNEDGNDISGKAVPQLGIHCALGEKNIRNLPFHTDVKNVILYHHENADGSGPFGKNWKEVPLFARIIHFCDLLDRDYGKEEFAEDTWKQGDNFITQINGSVVDEECINGFRAAFTEEHFLSLKQKDLEKKLWNRVSRETKELDFSQIKELAKFFARIVDYKSPFTSTHSIGVAETAERLARFMGFDEETAQKMYLAGALHDIGKVAIGNEILEKPGRLTDDEFAIMKHHAAYTYYILAEIDNFHEMRDWAAFHHEHLDGSGYPFGKTGEELNTQERIMACADIYQALTESRPYKKEMSHEKACGILEDMGGRGWLDKEVIRKVEECFGEVNK
ncbi:HD-GYP domain-containing protein [Blautia sp. HCP3S3_H10_1]|uniref:HD-GYP domain-containing protein n=1 Tax=unclassified Blautia TaxID=2648079 RepID=UPI003F8F6F83|nr:HD domain-containing protein [Clostridia bacterium]